MASTVIIENFVQDRRFFVIFTEDEFDYVVSNWEREDILLVELSNTTTVFEGKTRWSELKPLHWKFLVAKNLDKVFELNEEQQLDENNPVVKSLHFLIMGMIKCMEDNADITIEMMKIQYLSESTINFEFSGTVSLTFEQSKSTKEPEIKKPSFEIVVDNTKK